MSMPSSPAGSYQTIGGAPPNTLPAGFQQQPAAPAASENLGGFPMPAHDPQPQYTPQPQPFAQQPAPFQQQPQRPPQFAAQPFAPPQQPQQGFPPRSPSGSPMGGDPMFAGQPGAAGWPPADDLTLGGPAGGFQPMPQMPGQQPGGYQQPGPQTPPSTAIRDWMAQRGLASAAQYPDDEAVLQDLAQGAMELGHLRQLAGLGNEYLRQQSRGGTAPQPNGQPQPAAPATPAATTPAQPQAPEWRPEWAAYVRLNPESGLYEAKDPMATSPMIVQRANERATWEREQRRKMEEDPVAYLRERGLDEMIQKVRQETRDEVVGSVQEILRRRETEAQIGQWAEKNMNRFVVQGPDGLPARNPYTGEVLVNPRGQAAQRYSADFRQRFQQTYGRAPDHSTVIDHVETALARDEALGLFGQPPMAGQANGMPALPAPNGYAPGYAPQPGYAAPNGNGYPPQPFLQQPAFNQNEAMKNNLIQRSIAANGAFHQPGAGGTVAAAVGQQAVPQNPRLNLAQMFQQGAINRGIAHPEQF